MAAADISARVLQQMLPRPTHSDVYHALRAMSWPGGRSSAAPAAKAVSGGGIGEVLQDGGN